MSTRRSVNSNRCPVGVVCIENTTLLFSIFMLGSISIIVYVIYFINNQYLSIKDVNRHTIYSEDTSSGRGLFPRPNYSFSNIENDVLLNPYKEPVRDDRRNLINFDPRGLPINVKTQGSLGGNSEFRQVGILTKGETILPLMGRPLFSNRDKWNFYTMNDKANMIKLPMKFNNKDCLSEQGCDNIYNGDQVFVEGYSAFFKATIYENNVMRYLPFF